MSSMIVMILPISFTIPGSGICGAHGIKRTMYVLKRFFSVTHVPVPIFAISEIFLGMEVVIDRV